MRHASSSTDLPDEVVWTEVLAAVERNLARVGKTIKRLLTAYREASIDIARADCASGCRYCVHSNGRYDTSERTGGNNLAIRTPILRLAATLLAFLRRNSVCVSSFRAPASGGGGGR